MYSKVLFPGAYDFLMRSRHLAERRRHALARVRGRILEIGIGTGLSLDAYPDEVDRIWAIDPNPGMLRRLEAKKDRKRIAVETQPAGAEQIPHPDDSFDTVSCTHVICSLPDPARALAEVRRVLRPGGRLVFLEHGLSPDPAVARWQRRLNGIQRRFAVGCTLDLPVRTLLPEAGFTFEHLEESYLKGESRTHGYLYEGVAVPA
jgi:ubiquinone/menaquinone biosynthesis C-methylase UbiE